MACFSHQGNAITTHFRIPKYISHLSLSGRTAGTAGKTGTTYANHEPLRRRTIRRLFPSVNSLGRRACIYGCADSFHWRCGTLVPFSLFHLTFILSEPVSSCARSFGRPSFFLQRLLASSLPFLFRWCISQRTLWACASPSPFCPSSLRLQMGYSVEKGPCVIAQTDLSVWICGHVRVSSMV
jgi:hypothetical protein